MNILILSWRGPGHPNEGGAELVTMEHAKAWVKAGHDVTLFTSDDGKTKKEETIDGVHILRKGKQVFGVHLSAFFWYKFKKHKKFDLVIDQFHGIPFFTPLYIRERKLAFIHEVAKEVWSLNPWPKPFNKVPSVIGTKLEPFIFKKFYKNISFMTVSESTRDDLENWGIRKNSITVIHNGITLPKLSKLPEKNTTKTVMFLGAISEDKGIFDAIKIFGEINRKDDMWQFWIAGKSTPDYRDKMKKLEGELGIFEKTKYWGYVSEKKKFELLSASHFLINPSIREGWGLVNIEANAVGTPVVAYDVAGIRDSVINKKTGLLVKMGDFRSMAEKVIKTANDRQVYNKLVSESKKWSKKFSWEKSTKESLEFIESI